MPVPAQGRSLVFYVFVVAFMVGAYLVMRFVRRLRRRQADRPQLPALTQHLRLEQLAGSITARQALAALAPHMARFGGTRHMVFLSAGEGVDARGCSERWEIWFALPALGKVAMCQIEPGEPAVGGAKPPLYLRLRGRPIVPGATLEALPESFIDSPEGVAALAAQGVDFTAGDIHTLFQVKRDAGGRPAWYATAFEKEYYTPFSR